MPEPSDQAKLEQVAEVGAPVVIPGDGPAPVGAMGKTVGAGMAMIVLVTLLAKAATLIAQVVLGWKLTPEDFELFATATAIAGFVMVCREAGIRELWVQKGPEEYERLAGPGFWFALTWNVLVAVVMGVLGLAIRDPAPLLGVAGMVHGGLADRLGALVGSGDVKLSNMLLVMAVALPVGTAGGLLFNKLRLMMQYRVMSLRIGFSGIMRQFSSIVFVYGGAGYMSLAWPVLVGAAIDTLTGYTATRDKLWKRPAKREVWPELFRDSRWLMFASVANFAVDWGPFPLLRLFALVPKSVVGYFYFGFSITAQIGILLAFNFMWVLTPALQRLNEHPERQGQAAARSLRTLMLIGALSSLGLSVVIDPLEELIWNNKWQGAVAAVIVLGAFFPWRITFGITSSILQARGHFKAYAALMLVEGVGFTAATLVGALIAPTAEAMAWAAGLWLLVSRLLITFWVMRPLGVGAGGVIRSTGPAWVIALAAAGLGFVADRLIDLAPLAWMVSLAGRIVGLESGIAERIEDALRVVLTGGVFTVAAIVFCRAFVSKDLQEALNVAPNRLRGPMARVLMMRVRG